VSALLLAKVGLVLAVGQGLCWLLARGLGARLTRWGVALGLGLPLLFLSPFLLDSDNLLAPTATLKDIVPVSGLPPVRLSHLVLGDALYQFVPWELEVRHALRAGRLPLWSDLLDGGSSPWINPQAGVLSPLAMLARALPIQDLFVALLALKMLLAAEGTWLLARRLGLSRAAAALAAAGFTLGGGMMAWALFPHTTTLAWVPWLCLGCIGLLRHPRLRAIAATAAITAALLLSGHPETAAAGGLLAAICGIALHRRRTGLPRGLAAAGAAALLGFGLAAPQLLPFLQALPGSQRSADMLALQLPPPSPRLLSLASWFGLSSRHFLVAPLSPRAFGIPYAEAEAGTHDWPEVLGGYTGLVALAGGVITLVAWPAVRRWRAAIPWLAFAVAALLLAAGFAPLGLLREHVALLRLPAFVRVLPVACLALAVGGAFGIDLLLGRGRRVGLAPGEVTREGAGAAAGRLPGEAAQAGYARAAGGDHRGAPMSGVLLGLALAAAASLSAAFSPLVLLLWAVLLCAVLAAPRRRRLAGALLALVLALDLVPWAQRQLPRGQAALFYPANELTRLLAREAGENGRGTGIQRLLYPGLMAAYGIADVRINNVMAPASYQRVLRNAFGFDPTILHYYTDFNFPDHPLLSFLGVRAVVGDLYVTQPRTLVAVPAPQLLPFQVFRNPRALPRWFVPAAIETIERRDLDRWIAGMADPGRVALFADEAARLPQAAAVLAGSPPAPDDRPSAARRSGMRSADEEPPSAIAPAGASASGARRVLAAAPLAASPGHALLVVPGTGPRLLATSLPGPTGWQARAGTGGPSLSTLTVNGAFLGVLVPAGIERVDLRYRPPGLGTGTTLAGLALAGTLALALADRRRRPLGNRLRARA
jgi:hypothetical protein